MDNTPISAAAIGFSAFAKVYMELVSNLIEKGVDPAMACELSNELVAHFLTFTNNNKLAESISDVNIVAEEME